jgi:putative nucleotidyltransferase with HDIG domain
VPPPWRARLTRVKPVRWYGNVVIRTVRAFVPSLARPDDAFAEGYLRGPERTLYRRMDPRDRHHAVVVATRLLASYPQAEELLVRAALLHDVGKSDTPYRAWERIAVHVYTPPGELRAIRLPLRSSLEDAWRRHREHARRGAEMIVAAGGDARVADLVARHHTPGGDRGLEALALVDRET